jgi:hypothetical protein
MTWAVSGIISTYLANKQFLKDILDESQGYIKDDKVTLEVQVKAEPPKNIL